VNLQCLLSEAQLTAHGSRSLFSAVMTQN